MYGLALEGGGANGAFHMGAIKALLECGYEFGGVTGTSIGALNAAVFAQGDFEVGYKMWEDIDATWLFNIEEDAYKKMRNKQIDADTLMKIFTRVKKVFNNKGVDTSKIRALIESVVDEDKLRSSNIDFGLVTVSLTDLKPLEIYKEDIPKGKIVDYLMASSSFPGFKVEPLDDKVYLDGGFYDNCPINLIASKGYKDVVAIRTLAIGRVQQVKHPDVKVINIVPSEDLGMMMNFDNDIIKRNLKMGYFDALRAIKDLKGRKYYIEALDEELFLKLLLNIEDHEIVKLGEMLGVKALNPKRMLFERIIPEIAKRIGSKTSDTYQDIIIGMIELLAEDKDIEKYNIYSFNTFLSEIESVMLKAAKTKKSKGLMDGISKRFISNTLAEEIFKITLEKREILL